MTRSRARAGAVLALAATLSLVPRATWADDFAQGSPEAHLQPEASEGRLAILLPSLVVAKDGTARGSVRRPTPLDGPIAARAQELDSVLTDALQELGFTLDLSDRTGGLPLVPSETELLLRAQEAGAFIIAPRIEAQGGDYLVRLLVATPDSAVLRLRVERTEEGELPVRAAVMLRDLTVGKRGAAATPMAASLPVEPARPWALAVPARSEGRATLALNAAIFGGFVGYSIQRSSGSEDPRLLYPLMALGTGMGLGASMIIAEEWDVGIGDAWYLSAGTWWPAAAGFLIAEGRGVTPSSERFSYALAGAGAGIGLATFALTFRGMGEGGALLAHSGGAFGTVLGGLTELAVRGSTDAGTPNLGMGYGAAGGVLLAGALATQISAPSARVLGLDIGGGLGGLGGAAITSPFLFGRRTEGRERTFLVTTMAGTVVGGTIGWLVAPSVSSSARGAGSAPMAGVIGASQAKDGSPVPILGMGWRGEL